MKLFFHILLFLLFSAAFAAAGLACRTLWFENRRLTEEKSQLDVERIRFATQKEEVQAQCKALAGEKAQLMRELEKMRLARAKAAEELLRSQGECKELQKKLQALRATTDGKKGKTAGEKRESERVVLQEDSESLTTLLDMTDNAPRKK